MPFPPLPARPLILLAALLVMGMGSGAGAQSLGAIAYAPQNGQWGWSRGYSTRDGAEGRALDECRNNGGNACQVAVWFQNGCGALAVGANGWGSGWGDLQLRADEEALQVCQRYSHQCRIRLQICSQ